MCASRLKVDEIKSVAEALDRLRVDIERLTGNLETFQVDTAAFARMAALLKGESEAANDRRPAEPSSTPDARLASPVTRSPRFGDIVKLLGGRSVWKKTPTSGLEAHEAIEKGVPSKALTYVIDAVTEIPSDKLFDIVGISKRTVQRKANVPDTPLSQEQGSRLWKFAEILATATELMGDQKSAERWLSSPAIALDGRAPVDLMTTQAGTEMVEELLIRLEYGVYT